jgi:hypothetical protein
MAKELFYTFEEAEAAWSEIKNGLADFYDEDEEDDWNRDTDEEFFDKYGFYLMDF